MSGGLGIMQNSVFTTQNAALTTYNAALNQGIQSVREEDLWYLNISMETTSSTETELYDWLEQAADFREWKAERKFSPLRQNGYSLTNVDWDWGVEIHRNKFRDNQFLRQSALFQMGGVNARLHPQRRVAANLMGFATAGACWNGKVFFAADHPVDNFDSAKGTFSNRITNVLNPANFNLARAAMMKFKDASGEVLAAPPDTLMVPPDLVTTADLIARSIILPTVSGAALNTGIGQAPRQKIRVIECPELAAEPTAWYLARTRGPIKPVIVQKRTRPVVEFIEDLNSAFCKKNKKVQLGADYSAAFGWSFPQLMMRCGDAEASTTLS